MASLAVAEFEYWRCLLPVESAKLPFLSEGNYCVKGRIEMNRHGIYCDLSSVPGRFLLSRVLMVTPEGGASGQGYLLKLRTEQGRDNEHLLLRLLDSRAKGLEAVVGFSVQGGVSQPMSDVRYLKVPSVFEALVVSREITFIQKP